MPSKDPNKPSKSKVYSDEFKRSAVQLVTEQKYSIAAAARAVGVSEPSLTHRTPRRGGGSPADCLRIRNAELRFKQAA
ncbi:MAG: transposase [Planctomycetaceae bacterium]